MPFSETQTKALSAKLSARHVRTRQHLGLTLSYIEGWHAIAEANRIFGFDAWDRETLEARCVSEVVRQGRHHCSYTARVRVRVRAGDVVISREGSGAGHGAAATPGEAHESALKEAETDAMKRALMTFGNPFGLGLYDKEQRGVRRSGRQRRVTDDRPVSWILYSQTGEPVATHDDPVAYCSALRAAIEQAGTGEQIEAIWTRNQSAVSELKRALPDLRTGKGEHYADILEVLYRRRLKAFKKKGRAKKVIDRAGKSDQRIDTAVLEPKPSARIRDKDHLRYVASRPCLVCGRTPSHAHHIRFAQPRALGRKVSDAWTVPLCNIHHRALHDAGDEARFWAEQKIDPMHEAEVMWLDTTTGHQDKAAE